MFRNHKICTLSLFVLFMCLPTSLANAKSNIPFIPTKTVTVEIPADKLVKEVTTEDILYRYTMFPKLEAKLENLSEHVANQTYQMYLLRKFNKSLEQQNALLLLKVATPEEVEEQQKRPWYKSIAFWIGIGLIILGVLILRQVLPPLFSSL